MNIELFKNKGYEVRGGSINGEPWFIANDIARILGYRDSDKMTRLLDDDEKGTQIVGTPGGNQKMTIVNESGLYHAIFSSRKKEAQKFRKWVTNEVLPAIRKTGMYLAGVDPEIIEKIIPKGKFMEPNDDGFIKTELVRAYWRSDKNNPRNQLLQKRYELQKRLDGLLRKEIEQELEIIDTKLEELEYAC